MTLVLTYILGLPVLAFVVWVLFLAIMRLQEVRDAGKIPTVVLPFAYLLLGIGYFLDFSLNMAATFPFGEIPKEMLLSARVSRHINETGYRGKLSRWICHNFLDPFDPSGCHCK